MSVRKLPALKMGTSLISCGLRLSLSRVKNPECEIGDVGSVNLEWKSGNGDLADLTETVGERVDLSEAHDGKR